MPARSILCKRLLLVVHGRAFDDERWLAGGPFYTELSPTELQALSA